MPRQDPLRNFLFRLEIDGIQTAGFSEVSLLETTTAAIDYREGTDPPHVRKLSGLTKYGNIVLKRGVVAGSAALDLYHWHASVVAGGAQGSRRNVALVVLSENNPLARCPASDIRQDGDTLTFEIICPGGNQAVGSARYTIAPQRFTGVIAMKMGGKNMTMTEYQVGGRIGNCSAVGPPRS